MSGYTHTLTPHAYAHTPPQTPYTHAYNHHQRIQETHTQQAGTLLVLQDWQDLTGVMNGTHTHAHTHTLTHTHTHTHLSMDNEQRTKKTGVQLLVTTETSTTVLSNMSKQSTTT